MIISLTRQEADKAIAGAKDRYARVKREGLAFQKGQREGREGFHESDHIVGAVAEMAFYKYRGVPWSPTLDSVDHGDLGHYEIKATYRYKGNLLIPATYAGNKHLTFILAIVARDHDNVNFVGWISGMDALQDIYWRVDMQRPCWFVPRSDLTPPKT